MIYFIIFVVIVVFLALSVVKQQQKKPKSQRTAIKPKRILSLNEQPTFIRLQLALPDCIVLTQVAFSALMTASGYATRSLFNRKVADFVVLDQQFNIIAILELDDASHQHKQQQDADRDALIAEAGYRVIRYPRTPDFSQIQQDFTAIISSQHMSKAESKPAVDMQRQSNARIAVNGRPESI